MFANLCPKKKKKKKIKKLKILCSLDQTILFKIHKHMVQTFCKECVERLYRLPVTASATVARKSFNRKSLQKMIFKSAMLCYHLLMLTLEV